MNADSEIAPEILQIYYLCPKIFYYKNKYVIDFSVIHYCCRASARQLTNLDHSGSYEISGSRANLPPELYIVEISICVCYDVRFPLNRIFFSWKRGGEQVWYSSSARSSIVEFL